MKQNSKKNELYFGTFNLEEAQQMGKDFVKKIKYYTKIHKEKHRDTQKFFKITSRIFVKQDKI